MKLFIKKILGYAPKIKISVNIPTEKHGDNYGSWVIAKNSLTKDSAVFSVGIGRDIAFDLSIIKQYNTTMYEFDPTLEVSDWLKLQDLPQNFKYFPYALAATDSEVKFYKPAIEGHISHSMQLSAVGNKLSALGSRLSAIQLSAVGNRQSANEKADSRLPRADSRLPTADSYVMVPARRLSSLMRDFNIKHLDLLKMDIEGFEYDVIDDIIASNCSVKQLLIEFHHGMYGKSVADTEKSIEKLINHQFQIFHISESGREISFIK